MSVTMKAGVAIRDITPPTGTELTGFIAREQPSTGVRDPLYARALWLASGGERLLWLQADLLGFDLPTARRIRRAAAERLGLPVRAVALSATHTHGGPATMLLRACGEPLPGYLGGVEAAFLEAAAEAAAKAEPVRLAFGEGRATVAGDRRAASANSHVDPRLPVLAFRRADGSFLALLANYACHNTTLGGECRLVSADLSGEAMRRAAEALPGHPVVCLVNGGCGNVNPLGRGEEVVQRLGAELAAAIAETARAAAPCAGAEPVLATAERTISLPLLEQTRAEVEAEAKRIFEGLDRQPQTPFVARLRRAVAGWREDTLSWIAEKQPMASEMDVQAIRIGPASFACVSGEIFSRSADDLRARTSPCSYIAGYSNGNLGYIPIPEVYAEGGYEVKDAHRYYAHFALAPEAYGRILDCAAALVADLNAIPSTR